MISTGKESFSSVIEPAFLIDSNICIYVLRDAAGAAAIKIQEHEPGRVVTSAIVYAEVMRGMVKASREEVEKANRFFDVVPVQPFDQRAAERYVDVPFKRGRFDRLIAAHALALNIPIVTSNVADFEGVPGLKIEDWTR